MKILKHFINIDTTSKNMPYRVEVYDELADKPRWRPDPLAYPGIYPAERDANTRARELRQLTWKARVSPNIPLKQLALIELREDVKRKRDAKKYKQNDDDINTSELGKVLPIKRK